MSASSSWALISGSSVTEANRGGIGSMLGSSWNQRLWEGDTQLRASPGQSSWTFLRACLLEDSTLTSFWPSVSSLKIQIHGSLVGSACSGIGPVLGVCEWDQVVGSPARVWERQFPQRKRGASTKRWGTDVLYRQNHSCLHTL